MEIKSIKIRVFTQSNPKGFTKWYEVIRRIDDNFLIQLKGYNKPTIISRDKVIAYKENK